MPLLRVQNPRVRAEWEHEGVYVLPGLLSQLHKVHRRPRGKLPGVLPVYGSVVLLLVQHIGDAHAGDGPVRAAQRRVGSATHPNQQHAPVRQLNL